MYDNIKLKLNIERYICISVCVCAESPKSCPTLCNSMDYSPPGSSVHGILQARILELVAVPSSGDLPDPEMELASLVSPALASGFFTTSTTWEAHICISIYFNSILYYHYN